MSYVNYGQCFATQKYASNSTTSLPYESTFFFKKQDYLNSYIRNNI